MYDLRREDKDVFYDLNAFIVTLPVGLVSWLEALSCDSFLKHVGGHVYYDAIIPASIFVYYAAALRYQPSETLAKKAS